MHFRLSFYIVTISAFLSGCVTIPEYVLENESQRNDLFAECRMALRFNYQSTDPSMIDLTACEKHQELAVVMYDNFVARSTTGKTHSDENPIMRKINKDAALVRIGMCFAEFNRGLEVRDDSGRTGLAVCDNLVARRRHEETLEAIQRAKQDAFLWSDMANRKAR